MSSYYTIVSSVLSRVFYHNVDETDVGVQDARDCEDRSSSLEDLRVHLFGDL
jgi:hypothetical protein